MTRINTPQTLRQKLELLADAAKYDASCASSGTAKKNSLGGANGRGGIGSTEGMGICHAYAPDGRCISLLKVLLTNHCIFDCHYCVNRKSSNTPRARFTPQEIADLTISFYKRNYIEGLFLSSGIIKSSNHTMEQLVECARILREEHDFRGYIHLKTIPEASPELIERAGLAADRLSINIELPTDAGLRSLAPDHGSEGAGGAARHTHGGEEEDGQDQEESQVDQVRYGQSRRSGKRRGSLAERSRDSRSDRDWTVVDLQNRPGAPDVQPSPGGGEHRLR